jgi:hypothetical protein
MPQQNDVFASQDRLAAVFASDLLDAGALLALDATRRER